MNRLQQLTKIRNVIFSNNKSLLETPIKVEKPSGRVGLSNEVIENMNYHYFPDYDPVKVAKEFKEFNDLKLKDLDFEFKKDREDRLKSRRKKIFVSGNFISYFSIYLLTFYLMKLSMEEKCQRRNQFYQKKRKSKYLQNKIHQNTRINHPNLPILPVFFIKIRLKNRNEIERKKKIYQKKKKFYQR
jgi:hypothetical protein